MIIVILEEKIIQDINIALDVTRYTNIIISDGIIHYRLGVGGLPLIGDLQFILDARESELWQVAQDKDDILTKEKVKQLLFNSELGGGWTNNQFQAAIIEHLEGNSAKLIALRTRRDAILAAWT